nr:glycosyltransferase [Propionibacterium sp.]
MPHARLGVVMPCFNETEWVEKSVEALRDAAARADWPVDVLVVDDGSGEPTARLLDDLAARGLIRVLRQPNAGRFAARLAGLRAHDADYVLLLDARVLLHPDALATLRGHVDAEPASAWNAHVDVHTAGNPFAAFWSGLTKIGWRRYFARPRVVRFGTADFDAYPKGTGAFAAPRAVLLEAASGFDSLFADQRFASDDTKLLRNVAARTPIGIDPAFRVEYFGRDTASRWAKQVFFRGTTFVDGYVGTRGRAGALLGVLGVGLPLGVAAALRWPRAAAVTAVAGCAAG